MAVKSFLWPKSRALHWGDAGDESASSDGSYGGYSEGGNYGDFSGGGVAFGDAGVGSGGFGTGNFGGGFDSGGFDSIGSGVGGGFNDGGGAWGGNVADFSGGGVSYGDAGVGPGGFGTGSFGSDFGNWGSGFPGVSYTDGSQQFGNFFEGNGNNFYPGDSGGWNNFVSPGDNYFGGGGNYFGMDPTAGVPYGQAGVGEGGFGTGHYGYSGPGGPEGAEGHFGSGPGGLGDGPGGGGWGPGGPGNQSYGQAGGPTGATLSGDYGTIPAAKGTLESILDAGRGMLSGMFAPGGLLGPGHQAPGTVGLVGPPKGDVTVNESEIEGPFPVVAPEDLPQQETAQIQPTQQQATPSVSQSSPGISAPPSVSSPETSVAGRAPGDNAAQPDYGTPNYGRGAAEAQPPPGQMPNLTPGSQEQGQPFQMAQMAPSPYRGVDVQEASLGRSVSPALTPQELINQTFDILPQSETYPAGTGGLGIQYMRPPEFNPIVPTPPGGLDPNTLEPIVPGNLARALDMFNPISAAEARGRSRSDAAVRNEPRVPGAPPPGSPGRATPEQQQQNLREQRGSMAQELDSKPGLKEALFKRAFTEVGYQGPAAVQGWIESILNRVNAEARFGRTLEGALRGEYGAHPGFAPFGSKQGGYFPGTGGANSRTMTNKEFQRNARNEQEYEQNNTYGKIAPLYDQLLQNVLRGSNTALLSTGNSSGKTGSGILQTRIGGEKFGLEKYEGGVPWAQSMLQAPPGRGIGADVVAGLKGGAPIGVAAKPPTEDIPDQNMPLVGLPPPAVLESLAPSAYQGREGIEADYGQNYGREGRDSYPGWLTNIAEATQGQPYGNPTAGIPAPPTVTGPGGWTAGINQAYGPFGDQSREGANEYGQNYGTPPAITGPYDTAESEYGYGYGVGPPAETGPLAVDAEYGANYGLGPEAVGQPAPGWLVGDQMQGAKSGAFEDIGAPQWSPDQQTAGVTGPGVFTNPGDVPSQTLQDVGAPAGVQQAVNDAVEEAQSPTQAAELAYQGAKEAGANELQAETAAQVAYETVRGQELQALPDSKGDLLATPFDARFGEWPAPEIMTSTFGPDEEGMTGTDKGDLAATPFDARFGDWQGPVEAEARDSFDARFGEWQSPAEVANRGIGSDWGAARGVDPGLAPSLAAIGRGTPAYMPALSSVINNMPAAQRGQMEAAIKGLPDQDKAAILSRGVPALVDIIARQSGYPASQVQSFLNNSYQSFGYPGYPGGLAQLSADLTAANQQANANAIPGRSSTQFQDPSIVANVQDMGIPGWEAPSLAAKPSQEDVPTADMPAIQPLPTVTAETTSPTTESQQPGMAGASTQATQEVLSNPQSAIIVQNIAASYGVDIGTAALIYRLFFAGDIPEDSFPGIRAMQDGGRPYAGEPVLVGEAGPELFVPDMPGTVYPYVPAPGQGNRTWPKAPTPDYPGKYAGYGREVQRQHRLAQETEGEIMRLIDTGFLRFNPNAWEDFIKAQKPSKNIEDRRGEKD